MCSANCQVCNQTNGGCLSCRSIDKFGFMCDIECSKHCLNTSCSISGDCNLGCTLNFYGKKCDTPCPENCNGVVTGSRFSQENGVCKHGVRDETTSETC
ncbi:hypothetical protein DPMN_152596 [Dreissena polymorpha]|uniref:Uncharacterized protein n=1 Tax=Dreissena polymorpha TaxID=45954 RepID=A0A9D4FNA9_DREPO|nr:hypothetical protein DPMN_152596 [Dreissena polymorpha]